MTPEVNKKYLKLNLVKGMNSDIYGTSQVFMFNRKMKLIELKQQVCQFWELDPAEFELYEKSNLLLMRYEETVEMYFYSTIDAQRASPELILQVPDRTSYLEDPNKEQKVEQRNAIGEDQAEIEKRLKGKERQRKAVEIEQKYPGFSKCVRDGKRLQNRDLNIDNNVYAFLILLLMLILSIYVLAARRDVTIQYSIDKYVQEELNASFYSVGIIDDTSRSTGLNSFKSFINKNFTYFITKVEDKGLYTTVGKVRYRHLKVKEKDCPRYGVGCYERYYNDFTKGR